MRFTGKHVGVTRIGLLLTSTPSLCSSILPVCLRGQLKVRCGSVMTNAARTAVSVARSVVLHRVCTTIENVIALLMPMMSYNYLIWVGRSPARLISFFRPSVQNFSGEPPLGDLIYQHLTSFTHICQKCHMVVDSGFACITGCSLYLHMFTMLQKYYSLPLALLCMFLTSADCCECRSNWFNICCTQVNTYPPIACDGA